MQISIHLSNFNAFTGQILQLQDWMIAHQHWLVHKWGGHRHIWWHIDALRADLGWLMEHLTFPKHLCPPKGC